MKNLFFLLFFFSFFPAFSYSWTINLDGNNNQVNIPNALNTPCTISVQVNPAGAAVFVCLSYVTDSTASWSVNSEPAYNGSGFTCALRGGYSSATVSVTIDNSPLDSGDIGGGNEPVDPENPDDPDDPDEPDEPSNKDEPWALETTLQSTNKILDDILHNSGITFDAISGLNQPLMSIRDNQLANNSLLNSSDQKLGNIKNSLDTSNSKLENIKGTLDTSNSKLENIKGILDTSNSGLTNIKNTLDTTNSYLNNVRSNTSETVGNLRDIKDMLNPSGVSSPSLSSPIESLPSQSGFISGVKNKLLPGYSFFTPSGDEWLTFHFTVPLSSFGMSDFSFVFGGSDWSNVAGGSLLTVMSITRTLSKFAFYLMFLTAVIKSLRQW